MYEVMHVLRDYEFESYGFREPTNKEALRLLNIEKMTGSPLATLLRETYYFEYRVQIDTEKLMTPGELIEGICVAHWDADAEKEAAEEAAEEEEEEEGEEDDE